MEHFIWLNWASSYCHPCLWCTHFHRCGDSYGIQSAMPAIYCTGTLLSTMHRECSTYGFSKLHSVVTPYLVFISICVTYDHMKQILLFLFLLCQLLPPVMPICSLCETLLCCLYSGLYMPGLFIAGVPSMVFRYAFWMAC